MRLTKQGTLAFIEKSALESLHDFLAEDPRSEHGGVLVGRLIMTRGRQAFRCDS